MKANRFAGGFGFKGYIDPRNYRNDWDNPKLRKILVELEATSKDTVELMRPNPSIQLYFLVNLTQTDFVRLFFIIYRLE